MKEFINRFFCPVDDDTQDSSYMLNKLADVGVTVPIDQLENKNKATYKFLSISGTQFSYEHFLDDTKRVILGKMAPRNPVESLFAGVTA